MSLTTLEMEVLLAEHFGIRRNVIVPNVCWGVGLHECDLLVVRPTGHAVEVEIKISLADLKKDKDKWHGHMDTRGRIGRLYFAIPLGLHEKAVEHIPEHAGIITVNETPQPWQRVRVQREARWDKSAKFSEKETNKIAQLGAMRIWGLKRKLIKAGKA